MRYFVGDIVNITASFLGEPAGVRAFVYDTYDENSIAVITENGVDIGGFSRSECDSWIRFVKHTDTSYDFRGVLWLEQDFKKGLFKEAFA